MRIYRISAKKLVSHFESLGYSEDIANDIACSFISSGFNGVVSIAEDMGDEDNDYRCEVLSCLVRFLEKEGWGD